ncbi:MAG: carboxypeptidase regulatory-like domain-containing protein, partial [Candidatus Marinimicrobia bacterium]|nr:carboxypeptidase regulatory-like domain-containing protein [Candidatus Neomarinimicrobiota bacterium]
MIFFDAMKRSGHLCGLTFFITLMMQPLAGQSGRIYGTVTDAQTGNPLLGANVLANSPRLAAPAGSATDENGAYSIANLPAGAYTLTVTYIGYEETKLEIQLSVGASEQVDFGLNAEAIQFETYVITASRKRERVEDAPAAIIVITEAVIRRESNTNLGDYMKAVKGVDFTQSGVDSYNLSARGFNSSFSSRLLTLTDGRMANVPSLRLIAYNTIPVSFDDVKQIEVVLGPSSALYGPNAHSGVLNIVTKSPIRSQGTSLNLQAGNNDIRKIAFRHASAFGPFGVKISAVGLTAHEWEHINSVEYESHDPAFLGRPQNLRDRIANDNAVVEIGNPRFTAELLADLVVGEIPNNGIDDNGNGFIDETLDMVGLIYADGKDNFANDGEKGATITQEMIDQAATDPYGRYFVPGTNIVVWWITQSDLGKRYADGIDNDGDGLIDENIDNGIDNLAEIWYDGIDNDGDGLIDEADERGQVWLNRFGGFGPGQFGNYRYDKNGNIEFDSNRDGIYGGEGDSTITFGDLPGPRFIMDANGDGIDDFPDFDVRNLRYDVRADYEPNSDLLLSFSHGYAWARNINITGLARYLADGWIYRYYQGRFRYKNLFFQAYLNTSFSGTKEHPTRSLTTGVPIRDLSKKFSAQAQHAYESRNERLRFVWGVDYFLTLPDTRGTILGDNQMFDRRDNNGNGEDGSPVTFADVNE